MQSISFAKRLPADERTLYALSNLIPQQHIFSATDKRFKTYFGVYKLFKNIENGAVRVYGAFTEEKILAGVCFGSENEDNDFIVHIMFLRNFDAAAGCAKCADFMIKEYEAEGILINNIIGYIPEENRAAIKMAKKIGFIDEGLTKEMVFIKDEYHYPCRILKKKVR